MTATVLVVDDESDVTARASRILESRGYDCLTAADNDTALDLFAAHEPDCVVTDIYHDGADGLDLVRELKRMKPTLPLILFTGCLLTDFETEAVPDGVDYLMKPATMEDLVRRVERALLLSTIGEDAV